MPGSASFGVKEVSAGPQLLPKTIPMRPAFARSTSWTPMAIRSRCSSSRPTRATRSGTRRPIACFSASITRPSSCATRRRSLAFYRDLLGFRVAGESMNFGTEQEHLNNVPGARLHITGLRAAAGPGIEFLEYLQPRDGRPYPGDERANDLVHWQTTVSVPDAAEAARPVKGGNFRLLSASPVALPDTALGFSRGVLVRDPDGHVIQLIEGIDDEGDRGVSRQADSMHLAQLAQAVARRRAEAAAACWSRCSGWALMAPTRRSTPPSTAPRPGIRLSGDRARELRPGRGGRAQRERARRGRLRGGDGAAAGHRASTTRSAPTT